MRRVVKVGGSLLADVPRLRDLLAALADGTQGACAIVPGGGPDADAVRAAQAAEGFSDAEAHRRALDAMGRTALRFRPSRAAWSRASPPGRPMPRPPWSGTRPCCAPAIPISPRPGT